MIDYQKKDASFTDVVKIYEPTDRAHADVLNVPLKMLYENTVALNENKLDADGTAENAKTVDGHTVGADVPEGAKFTDTTYDVADGEHTGLTKLYTGTGNAEDGAMTQQAATSALYKKCSTGALQVNSLEELAHRRSFAGSMHVGSIGTIDSWYNVISARHIGGADDVDATGDETKYGMYLKSGFYDGNLTWGKQYHNGSAAGTWTGERTILDSSNYRDYVKTNVVKEKVLFSGNMPVTDYTNVSLSGSEENMFLFGARFSVADDEECVLGQGMEVFFRCGVIASYALCGNGEGYDLSMGFMLAPVEIDSFYVKRDEEIIIYPPEAVFYIQTPGGKTSVLTTGFTLYLEEIRGYYLSEEGV